GNIRSYRYLDDVYHRVHNDKLWQQLSKMLQRIFPDQQAYVASYSKDKKKFIIHVSSPTNPGDYYFLNMNSKKMDWFSEVYPGLDDEKLSPVISMSYKARDGLDIPAYLTLPVGVKEQKNMLTIIMPHGGPFARDSYGFDYWAQFLATRGYAVLQMNYRGSTGYGEGYEALGHNEWGGKMLDDINDGAHWMIEQGYADPKRICIVGGSYGGYAALQTLIKEPGLYNVLWRWHR
ncbi:MAG: S9 family peptidase, partial [Emcibacter sp.]|nr:S9 family peptidase [Emcibacter sp.]